MLHCLQLRCGLRVSESSWARPTCRLKKEGIARKIRSVGPSPPGTEEDEQRPIRAREEPTAARPPSQLLLSPLSPHTNSAERPSPPSPLHPRPGQTRPCSRSQTVDEPASLPSQWQKEEVEESDESFTLCQDHSSVRFGDCFAWKLPRAGWQNYSCHSAQARSLYCITSSNFQEHSPQNLMNESRCKIQNVWESLPRRRASGRADGRSSYGGMDGWRAARPFNGPTGGGAGVAAERGGGAGGERGRARAPGLGSVGAAEVRARAGGRARRERGGSGG